MIAPWIPWALLALAFILLLALGLRLYRIDGQSLWYDEGTSVALAMRDLPTITRDATADIHPPLYYYLLHTWVGLVVFLTFLLGRRLFGVATGLLAAFLSALSPFQVYYSQETRMYILVTALGAASVLALIKWLDDSADENLHGKTALPTFYLFTWVLSTTLALYTHYFALSLLLIANLVFGTWLLLGAWRIPDTRRRIIAWLLAQGIVLITYLPWLLLSWRQLQTWPAVSSAFTLTFLVGEVLRVFPLGLSAERTAGLMVWLLAGILIAGSLPVFVVRTSVRYSSAEALTTNKGRDLLNLSIALLYCIIPVATVYLLSLRRPLYNPKFLLLATPGYFLLVAHGILTLSGWIGAAFHKWGFKPGFYTATPAAVLALLVATAEAQSLNNYYFDPRYARDDYRGIASYVAAAGRTGDAIILNAPAQVEIFRYYYRGNLEIYPLPRRRPPDPTATRQAVAEIVARHNRIFAVLWATEQSDPDRLVESLLDRSTYKAVDSWWGNVRLALFATPTHTETALRTANVDLGGQITLTGYDAGPTTVTPGDVLPVSLFWQATAPISQRLKVFIHVLDAQGNILAQRDAEPTNGDQPTVDWQPGDRVIDRQGVLIPYGTPPVAAQIVAGLYRADTGQRLTIVASDQPGDKDRISLGQVQIERPAVAPPIEVLGIRHRVDAAFGPVRLLGYNQHRLGYDHAPETPLAPGAPLHLGLYWRASASNPFFTIHAQLEDTAARGLANYTITPTGDLYPPDRWVDGEVVRDQHRLPLPGDLAPGAYRLRLDLARTDGTALGQPLVLQPFQVE